MDSVIGLLTGYTKTFLLIVRSHGQKHKRSVRIGRTWKNGIRMLFRKITRTDHHLGHHPQTLHCQLVHYQRFVGRLQQYLPGT